VNIRDFFCISIESLLQAFIMDSPTSLPAMPARHSEIHSGNCFSPPLPLCPSPPRSPHTSSTLRNRCDFLGNFSMRSRVETQNCHSCDVFEKCWWNRQERPSLVPRVGTSGISLEKRWIEALLCLVCCRSWRQNDFSMQASSRQNCPEILCY